MKPKTKRKSHPSTLSFIAFFQSANLKNRQATVTFLLPPESHDAVIELNARNAGLAMLLEVTDAMLADGEETEQDALLAKVLAEIEAQG